MFLCVCINVYELAESWLCLSRQVNAARKDDVDTPFSRACVSGLSNGVERACMLLDRTSSAQCEKHIQTDQSYAYIRRDREALDPLPLSSWCTREHDRRDSARELTGQEDEGSSKAFGVTSTLPRIYSEERCEYMKIVIRDRVRDRISRKVKSLPVNLTCDRVPRCE